MRTTRQVSQPITVSLTTSATTTPVIVKDQWSGGIVNVPAGSSITSLTFHAASSRTGTFLPLYDGADAVVLTVAESRSVGLPAAIAHAPFLKIVANAAGAVTITWMG